LVGKKTLFLRRHPLIYVGGVQNLPGSLALKKNAKLETQAMVQGRSRV
jgi:hypothetical protein